MCPSVSVLRKIGDHVGTIQEAIAANRDGNNINTIVKRKVTALASYIQQVAKEAQETTKETKAADTGDEEGSWRKETEEIYPLRALIFFVHPRIHIIHNTYYYWYNKSYMAKGLNKHGTKIVYHCSLYIGPF